jgi:hypothetical protein
MDDFNQIEIPESFVALFIAPGRSKPNATRITIAARYEFCEDLASHLVEYGRAQHFDLGITETDVLERVLLGLMQPASQVNEAEAHWVVRRLAELVEWAYEPPSTRP